MFIENAVATQVIYEMKAHMRYAQCGWREIRLKPNYPLLRVESSSVYYIKSVLSIPITKYLFITICIVLAITIKI